MAAESVSQVVDPRIRRTRQLLQQSLQTLLETEDFDKISVQDIADAATINRVTFYDHFTGKSDLLERLVESRFEELITHRGIKFDCSSALKPIVLAVCDYLSGTGLCAQRQREVPLDRQLALEPHLESAIIAVVRRMILDGLRQHPPPTAVPLEMIAATLSWAIYGAAREWVRTPGRCSSEEILDSIMLLLSPLLQQLHASPPAETQSQR